MIRLLVGDRTGTPLAELEAGIGPVSWRLNDVGRAQWTISRREAKATAVNLRFGNRVLMEFDNGLPAWVGVIDTPREWANGIITVNAYSGEYILKFRQTDRGRYFTDATVGEIYQKLIEETNAVSDTGIGIGAVWHGGPGHYPEYHFKNLLAIIRESLCGNLSSYDWDVTGGMVGGKIALSANLYERKGALRPNVALIEGHNVGQPRLVEQGEIINWWDLAGSGNDWGDERIYAHAQDGESMGLYGLRQGQAIYGDVVYQGTLQSNADTLLSESKGIHAMLDLVVVDEKPARFADYGVGDTIRVQLVNYGFGGYDGLVTVEAREYDPKAGVCRLVVREN